ncbi:hypothetical protein BASA_1667 [Bifidobacterium animalis subsp. animalis]|nr:hypothetical protein BASA_1667 [Bifidobacterium animalis subsp. animalis]
MHETLLLRLVSATRGKFQPVEEGSFPRIVFGVWVASHFMCAVLCFPVFCWPLRLFVHKMTAVSAYSLAILC